MSRKAVTSANIITLLEKHHLLSAVEILSKLHEKGSSQNKTTIYRALDRLLAEGKVCRQTLGDDVLLYELKEHSHSHIVCERCGEIRSLPDRMGTVEGIDGFSVTHEHRTVFGICRSCSGKIDHQV